jgi:hypothetical protein
MDPSIINRFANHPDIRPHVGGSGPLDLTSAVKAPNVFLFGEFGGFCLSWTAPDTYEVHTMIAPEGRGKWAFRAARDAKEYMASIGAIHLWTRVHPQAANTAMFTRIMGFSPRGSGEIDFGQGRPEVWNLFDWRIVCP